MNDCGCHDPIVFGHRCDQMRPLRDPRQIEADDHAAWADARAQAIADELNSRLADGQRFMWLVPRPRPKPLPKK